MIIVVFNLGTNWLAFKAWTIHILPLTGEKQKLVF